jgi:hypothetical protein
VSGPPHALATLPLKKEFISFSSTTISSFSPHFLTIYLKIIDKNGQGQTTTIPKLNAATKVPISQTRLFFFKISWAEDCLILEDGTDRLSRNVGN